MTYLTQDRLNLLKRLLGEASDGPWEVVAGDAGHSLYDRDATICDTVFGDHICDMSSLYRVRDNVRYKTDGVVDAELIVTARNALPELLDAVDERDALKAQLQDARERLQRAAHELGRPASLSGGAE